MFYTCTYRALYIPFYYSVFSISEVLFLLMQDFEAFNIRVITELGCMISLANLP